jgi:transcriptional regulator with XRE-family HTH domain
MFLMGNNIIFSEWLNEQLKARNWTQAQLAKSAGLGRAVINKIINQFNKHPDPQTCVSIARALKLSPITVFRAAGLLPEEPARVAELDDLAEILPQLSAEGREEVLAFAQMKLDLEARRKKQ